MFHPAGGEAADHDPEGQAAEDQALAVAPDEGVGDNQAEEDRSDEAPKVEG